MAIPAGTHHCCPWKHGRTHDAARESLPWVPMNQELWQVEQVIHPLPMFPRDKGDAKRAAFLSSPRAWYRL